MKHYPFGSSTAARTDACPAWRAESEGIPSKESQFALDGTIVHHLLEMRALDDDYDFNAQMGKTVEGGLVTGDLIEIAVDMWAVTVQVLQKHGAIEWEAETTGQAADDVGGTLDMIANCGDKALLIDYKTGRGVQVDPVNNKQILFATAVCEIESGASDMLEDKDHFVGIIIQPNSSGDIQVKEWEFARDQVDAFWDRHLANIAKARAGEGNLCAGDHCKFCPANGLCDATTGNMLRLQQLNLQDQEQLVEGLGLIEAVKETIRAIEKMAYEQLEVGVELPGWKLVAKRANRSWKDEAAAINRLRRPLGGKKAIVNEKLKTPAQIEKLAKSLGVAVDLEELTSRESSGTTLAPESDKREAVLSAQAFGAALASVQ